MCDVKPSMEATHSPDKIISKLLSEISTQLFSIFAVVQDILKFLISKCKNITVGTSATVSSFVFAVGGFL